MNYRRNSINLIINCRKQQRSLSSFLSQQPFHSPGLIQHSQHKDPEEELVPHYRYHYISSGQQHALTQSPMADRVSPGMSASLFLEVVWSVIDWKQYFCFESVKIQPV